MRGRAWAAVVLALVPLCAQAEPRPQLELTRLADGFVQPVDLVFVPGSPRALVVEQGGRVRQLVPGGHQHPVALDLTDRVVAGGEMGLLGLAFHPDFSRNGRVFLNYTTKADGPLGTRISEFRFDPDTLAGDPGSERILLRYDQPYRNHNGGMVLFGPDGYLYIGTGDGGAANDPHDHGQRLDSLLGKMLRVDVDRTEPGQPYGIPADNPFRDRPGVRPEIYAYGLRNPWRYSFDRRTGDLWCGDVGQNAREEIDLITKGGNYGWRIMEGFIRTPRVEADRVPADLIPPVVDYPRSEGVSVTGGYVYRGTHHPGLQGLYLYADFGSGNVWGLRYAQGRVVENRKLISRGPPISSFAEDAGGELYAVGYAGTLYRIQPAP